MPDIFDGDPVQLVIPSWRVLDCSVGDGSLVSIGGVYVLWRFLFYVTQFFINFFFIFSGLVE